MPLPRQTPNVPIRAQPCPSFAQLHVHTWVLTVVHACVCVFVCVSVCVCACMCACVCEPTRLQIFILPSSIAPTPHFHRAPNPPHHHTTPRAHAQLSPLMNIHQPTPGVQHVPMFKVKTILTVRCRALPCAAVRCRALPCAAADN